MEKPSYKNYRERLAGTPFPFVALDINALQSNIEQILVRSGSKNIRIASKSIRCRQAMNIILDSNTRYNDIMTYHPRETIFLANQGFDNLLMGYPTMDKVAMKEIIRLIKSGKYICFMADHPDHIDLMDHLGKEENTIIPVCIDLDLSSDYPGLRFGVWRSQIMNLQDLTLILNQIKERPNLRLDGLMGYEAQIAGVPDQAPGQSLKNIVIRLLKRRSIDSIYQKRKEAVDLVISQGFNLRFVNGGGTGSIESTRTETWVTEITVGSGFFAPHLFDHYKNFSHEPALTYAVPIVRKPSKNIYTCHGGGYIASGGIDKNRQPSVYLPPGGFLDTLEGAGEVQTPVYFKNNTMDLKMGDPIFLRHAKAGELCEHFNEIIFMYEDSLETYPTYRGEGMSFG